MKYFITIHGELIVPTKEKSLNMKGIMTNSNKNIFIIILIALLLALSAGCSEQKQKALMFELGPDGVETSQVDGDWALKSIHLGAKNAGTKAIRSFDMEVKLIRDGEVIDKRRIGPWQGIPADGMRVFRVKSLDDEDPYLLRMSNPQPGEYTIRLTSYDSQNNEKIGEADIPFEIKKGSTPQ